mgnify:CR=1 FL=1
MAKGRIKLREAVGEGHACADNRKTYLPVEKARQLGAAKQRIGQGPCATGSVPYPHISRICAATSIGAGAGRTSAPCIAGDQWKASKRSRISRGMKRVRIA